MASPNTVKLMRERYLMRVGTVKIISAAEPGENREARRKASRRYRLRSKMRPDRYRQMMDWKNPKPPKNPVELIRKNGQLVRKEKSGIIGAVRSAFSRKS